MGRTKKKPGYDQNRIMEQFQNCIVEAYTSGMIDGSGISLRQVSEEFGITLMKTRKILITAGVYHTENSEKINSMREQGMSIPEIMKATGLSKSSVHSYLPYTKIIYNLVFMQSVAGCIGKESKPLSNYRYVRRLPWNVWRSICGVRLKFFLDIPLQR